MFWQEADVSPYQHGDNENEALQTDIQRFIAIIGFCLMAVFALVQAIPVTDPEKDTVIEDLRHDAGLQEKEFEHLESENHRLSNELDRLVKDNDLSGQGKGPEVKGKEPAKEKGLYVAFESDRVFLDLLGSGKISLFINVVGMKRGFQVVTKEGKIGFTAGFPGGNLDLWEVKENMVPIEILDAFKAWTTLSSREKMLIVGLVPGVSRQIRDRKVSSGRFIIGDGGRVSYSHGGD